MNANCAVKLNRGVADTEAQNSGYSCREKMTVIRPI